jgi:hypothetical protein
MPALTRRRYPERQDCWHVYYGDVHRAVLPNGRKLVTLRPSKSVSLEMFPIGDTGGVREITMRTILIFVATSFVLLMPQASLAQACKCIIAGRATCYPATECGSAGGMCNGIWPAPAGNYAQSCHSCVDSCDQLTCVCKKADGREQVTEINVLSCPSERLSNINGNLACGP